MIRRLIIMSFLLCLPAAHAEEAPELPVLRVMTPNGPSCTGALIGPSTVLTAAHCLINRAGDGLHPVDLVQVAHYDQETETQTFAKAIALVPSPEYPLSGGMEDAVLAQDWALIHLDRRLELTPAALGLEDGALPALSVAAYGRAGSLRTTVHGEGCRVVAQTARLIRHDCLVERGSSGSVLMSRSAAGVIVHGVNVAIRYRMDNEGRRRGTTTAVRPVPEIAELLAEAPEPPEPWRSPFDR